MESRPQENSGRGNRARHGMPTTESPCDLASFRTVVAANDTRMSQLARTIEQEIIPRLMLAHRAVAEPLLKPAGFDYTISQNDVDQFARLVMSHDEDIAYATVQKLRGLDVSVEKIYIDLLAPTARYLGTLWEDDRCSFTDVTIGLGRLQRVLRELSPSLGQGVAHPADGRRLLLLPSPGEQHTFGVLMVGDFFRRAGWHVTSGAWGEGADPAELTRAEWFDVVGFSLGAAIHLERLAASIAAVRHAACNRDIKVLVGGPLFALNPEYADQLGADAVTIDGHSAPALAESLILCKASAEVMAG